MAVRVVSPRAATGWNTSFHPAGPKWSITCGDCGHTFRVRVPVVRKPRVLCPACRCLNEINVVPVQL